MLIRKELYDKINAWADAHAEEMAADLQEFARIKSVSRPDLAAEGMPFGPDNKKMLTFAVEKAKSYGFDAEDHDGWYADAWIGDKANAVGIIGHLDVVPEGDGWHYPPYAATREGDYLIGRGVSDNKSACIAALYILRMLRDIEAPLTNGVRAVFGISEENGMADMRHMVEANEQPPVSVVPDSMFPVNYAQKGTMRGAMSIDLGEKLRSFTGGEVRNMVAPYADAEVALSAAQLAGCIDEGLTLEDHGDTCILHAKGRAAHAASPADGLSAIWMLSKALSGCEALDEQSRKAMNSIREMSADWTGTAAGIACEDAESGKTTMVCGVAKMQDGRVSMSLDCRLSIAADLEKTEAAFRSYAEGLGFRVDDLATGKPFYMPKDDPRIELLRQVCADLLDDKNAEPYTMGGGTYSRVVTNAITFGMGIRDGEGKRDMGPGHGGAHQPDEYLYLPKLVRGLKVLACAVLLLDRLV